MRREFIPSFGRVTGNQTEHEVDARLREVLDSEDPDLIWDLRVNSEGRPEICKTFIDGKVETAADERRHGNVASDDDGNMVSIAHLAMAISTPDLHRQICATLPVGVPIPSVQWLRLQFWLRTSSRTTSKYYTGRLKIKFMVQARQFRQSHCHYASALFKYEKEFAIKYKKYVDFIAMDGKHTCKVGEPGLPVAAVERGKEVIVAKNQSLQVADHDFTKLLRWRSMFLMISTDPFMMDKSMSALKKTVSSRHRQFAMPQSCQKY